MSVHPDDLLRLVDQIRYDATAIQAKVTELKTMLASLNLRAEAAHVCPKTHCRIPLATEKLLVEHLENVHGEIL